MIKTNELEEYLNYYMNEKSEIKNLTSDTVKKQRYNIKKFILFLKNNSIEELNEHNTKNALRMYRRHCLHTNKNKRTTVHQYIINILDFLNFDDIQEKIKHKKIKAKDIIEVHKENPDTAKKRIEKISLTKTQANFFLNTIQKEHNLRDYAICKTFIETGLRLKELCLLDKKDIQVPINEEGFYILPENPNKLIDVYVRAEITKGEYKDRITFISYSTLLVLNQMILDRIIKTRKKHGKYKTFLQTNAKKIERSRNELFTNKTGDRISKRAVQDIVKKYAYLSDERIQEKKINCPICYKKSVSTHILRHTALSHYAEILTVAEVQSIAGHSNSSTTDKYIHIDREEMKRKIEINL